MSEINELASDFLRAYLENDPTIHFPKVVSAKQYDIDVDSEETAQQFLRSLPCTETTETVLLMRFVRKHRRYFAGFRRDGAAVWSYQKHLGIEVSADKLDETLTRLPNGVFAVKK